ncbi:MAG: aldose epimerase family protein [Fimbriimonadales bacterium]
MIRREPFGTVPGGTDCSVFSLESDAIKLKLADYGGTIVSIQTPDRDGVFGEVTLGFDSVEEYANHGAYFGCLVGRFANRIAFGRFSIDDVAYQVSVNSGRHQLHGGSEGFDRRVWRMEETEFGVKFGLRSLDGDQGYPGNLRASAEYVLRGSEVELRYHAETDVATIVNLTNHAYFNLAGSGVILDHTLQVAASSFTPTDDELIPTGEIRSVENTPFDFRSPKRIGERMNQISSEPNGYDHNFVLDVGVETPAATLCCDQTGRKLEVFTDQPALQVYTGNFLDGSLMGRDGRPISQHAAICLETQGFPDAPNHPEFPSVVLRPGEAYDRVTKFRFSTF